MVPSMSLLWAQSELPQGCHYRRLSPLIDDSAHAGSPILPIDRNRTRIEDALRSHSLVVVQAATGSGKTII